jgi:hypothetical protein
MSPGCTRYGVSEALDIPPDAPIAEAAKALGNGSVVAALEGFSRASGSSPMCRATSNVADADAR